MELYIGGYAQGKREYVKSKYPTATLYDENYFPEINDIDQNEVLVWDHFHLAIRKMLKQGMSRAEILELISGMEQRFLNLIIIADEIGNGIVPLEKEERIWREETGRIMCQIAKQATRVERIICGIPQIIK